MSREVLSVPDPKSKKSAEASADDVVDEKAVSDAESLDQPEDAVVEDGDAVTDVSEPPAEDPAEDAADETLAPKASPEKKVTKKTAKKPVRPKTASKTASKSPSKTTGKAATDASSSSAKKTTSKKSGNPAKAAAADKKAPPSRTPVKPKRIGNRWAAPAMLTSAGIGLLWIVVFYVTQGTDVELPLITDLKSWNLVIGMGFIVAAFGFSMKWE